MPLTKKGLKIREAMQKFYGKDKGVVKKKKAKK
jgi:hypothetical protein